MVGSAVHCSRCGKDSILIKTWQEKLETRRGESVITHEQYRCPDPACQKLVDATLAERKVLATERAEAAKLREDNRLQHKTE